MVTKLSIYTLLISSTLAMHSHTSNASGEYDSINDKQTAIQKGTDILTQDYIDNLILNSKEIQLNALASHESIKREISIAPMRHYKILISDSMGGDALNTLFKEYQYRDDVSFVIRGLLPTERTFNDAAQRIMRLMQGFKQVPNISLDPRPFKYMNTETVPHLLVYDGDSVMASVSGLTNIPWVKQQLSDGNTGDLGSYGSQVKITERNIEDILKERTEALDKQALIDGAKERFWNNRQYLTLPTSDKTQQRVFAPVITLHEDIISTEGHVIALKGQQFNTLESMPFTQRLVIFDATNVDELAFVKALPKSSIRTKYITTEFNHSLKWDAVKSVERELNASVFQLNADIINAFNVRVTPSVIVADNDSDVFLIDEYHLINGEVR